MKRFLLLLACLCRAAVAHAGWIKVPWGQPVVIERTDRKSVV